MKTLQTCKYHGSLLAVLVVTRSWILTASTQAQSVWAKRVASSSALLIALTLALNPIAKAMGGAAHAPSVPAHTLAQTNVPIPWDQIGAKAGADYHGDGLAVTPAIEGARLHCVFQRLEGEATRGGLWLVSTVTNTLPDRFQVKAVAIGRSEGNVSADLCLAGKVAVEGQCVKFVRPGLT